MTRSLAFGLAVLLAGDIAFAFAGRMAPEAAAWGAWLVVGVAAFVASWSAPRARFVMGLLVAPCNAAVVSVLQAVDSARGRVSDFPGIRGAIAVFELYLFTSAIAAALGSFAAYLLSRYRRSPRAPVMPATGSPEADTANQRDDSPGQ